MYQNALIPLTLQCLSLTMCFYNSCSNNLLHILGAVLVAFIVLQNQSNKVELETALPALLFYTSTFNSFKTESYHQRCILQ